MHPSLPGGVKVKVIVLVPELPRLEQGWSLFCLTSNTVTWTTFSWKPECGEGGNKRRKAAEAYFSTRFEAVKGVHNENMGYTSPLLLTAVVAHFFAKWLHCTR